MIEYVDLTQQARHAAADSRANIELGYSMAAKSRQYQLELAQLALQQEHQNLQAQQAAQAMQIQGYNFQRQQGQDAAFSSEIPALMDHQTALMDWAAKGDPTAPMPAAPKVSSVKGAEFLRGMQEPMQNVLANQSLHMVQTANAQQLRFGNEAADVLLKNGNPENVDLVSMYPVADRSGKPNPENIKVLMDAAGKVNAANKALADRVKLSSLYSKESLDVLRDNLRRGLITQEQFDEAAPFAKSSQKERSTYKDVQGLIARGIIDPSDENSVLEAEAQIRNKTNERPDAIKQRYDLTETARKVLNDAQTDIKKFDQKYGSGAFAQYIGPFNKPVYDATGLLKGLDAAQAEAKNIFGKINDVKVEYQKGTFGTAVTGPEKEDMKELFGSATRNDFLVMLDSFKNALAAHNGYIIRQHPYDSGILDSDRQELAPDTFRGRRTTTPAGAAGGPAVTTPRTAPQTGAGTELSPFPFNISTNTFLSVLKQIKRSAGESFDAFRERVFETAKQAK
jgi:hypothetical protein